MVASCYTVQVLLIEWSLYEGQRTEWLMFSTTHQTVKRLTHYVIWTCRRGRGCKKLPIFANILYGWPLMLCVSDSPCYYAASQYYMDAACCYLSVCQDHDPCKNGWTDRDAVWHVGPRNHVFHGVLIGAIWWIRLNRPVWHWQRCQITNYFIHLLNLSSARTYPHAGQLHQRHNMLNEHISQVCKGNMICVLLHCVWQAPNESDRRILLGPPPQPFYGPFSRTTCVSQCQKRTSRVYGARKD